jgi:oxalate decarboxylase
MDADQDLSRRRFLGGAAGLAGSALVGATLPAAAGAATGADPGLPAASGTYAYPLAATSPQVVGSSGSLVLGSKNTFPVLTGQNGSFALMRVAPGGLREPHWHPDSWELQYYVAGSGVVEIVLVTGESAQLEVGPGSLVFLPQGCGHCARNTGSGDLVALLGFQVDVPRSIGLGVFFSGMSTGVTTQTLGVPLSTLANAPKPAKGDPFPPRQAGNSSPPTLGSSLPVTSQVLGVALAAMTPQVIKPGGSLTSVNPDVMPALAGTKASVVYGRVQPGALREPHWHPNAWEINYCLAGAAEFGIVLPDATRATMRVGPGDAVFVPQGAGHYLDSVGDADLEFVAFFNADAVTDIGLSTFYGGLPTRDVAQTLRVPAKQLAAIPRPAQTAAIVPPL